MLSKDHKKMFSSVCMAYGGATFWLWVVCTCRQFSIFLSFSYRCLFRARFNSQLHDCNCLFTALENLFKRIRCAYSRNQCIHHTYTHIQQLKPSKNVCTRCSSSMFFIVFVSLHCYLFFEGGVGVASCQPTACVPLNTLYPLLRNILNETILWKCH